MTSKNVGLIGLGAMGLGIAKTLRNNGFNVHVYERCAPRCGGCFRERRRRGLCIARGARSRMPDIGVGGRECRANRIRALRRERRGRRDAGRQHLRDVLDGRPNWSIALEARLAEQGVNYVDGPISGGAAKAASGRMTMMTSAKPAAYAAADAVLDAMAGKVYRLGDGAGAGSKVKIINQLLAGVHIAAVAEAMALGLREGVDAAALYEVITNSAGNSWMFENRMAHVLAADYTPLSAVDIFVKDLGLVLDTARASKFPLPLASTAHQMFMQASTAGFAKEDDSAVIKIFPGIELPKKKDGTA